MSALADIFGSVVGVRNAFYDRGLLRSRRLRGPVLSVGNISVGGTGKTPFVIALGELLKGRGIRFDVLSRGYRRKSSGVLLVDPKGTPRDFGDEPLLIARKLEVPVIVGESRYLAGLFAERRFGPQLHLLDDGFQHRQLARDYDIVLLTPEDAHGQLLPTGRLREPVSSLQRADAVVLTSRAIEPSDHRAIDGDELTPPRSENNIVWGTIEHKLVLRVERAMEVADVPPKPVAFCAIGRPEQFFHQLREHGVEPVAEVQFRDHRSYTQADVASLQRTAGERGAGGFVTTEKDAINLGALAAQLQPLAIAQAVMALENADAALDAILRMIQQRHA